MGFCVGLCFGMHYFVSFVLFVALIVCGGAGGGSQRFVMHCILSCLGWRSCHTEKREAGCFVYLCSCLFIFVSKNDQDQNKNQDS